MAEKMAAEVIFRDADTMSDAERRFIASWLRTLADNYEKDGAQFGYNYTGGMPFWDRAKEKVDG